MWLRGWSAALFCTPSPCVSRHTGAFGNLDEELTTMVTHHMSNNLKSTLGCQATAGERVDRCRLPAE